MRAKIVFCALGLAILAALFEFFPGLAGLYWPDGWIFPIPGHSVTSEYCTDNTAYGGESCHTGIDIGTATEQKANILASAPGQVVFVQNGWAGYQNFTVFIFHGWDNNGNKICTQYSHVRYVLVHVGEVVGRGEILATAYGTDSPEGFQFHLHFGAYLGDCGNPVYRHGNLYSGSIGFFNPRLLPTIKISWDKRIKPEPPIPGQNPVINFTPILIVLIIIGLIIIGGVIFAPGPTITTIGWILKTGMKSIIWTSKGIYTMAYWTKNIGFGSNTTERKKSKYVLFAALCSAFILSTCVAVSSLAITLMERGVIFELPTQLVIVPTVNATLIPSQPTPKPPPTSNEGESCNKPPGYACEPRPVFKDPPDSARKIIIRASHYWPPLGGVNCSNFVGGLCLSTMASGKRWEAYVDRAVACPSELPFGTKIYAWGQEFLCLDRGGKIVKGGKNVFWIDVLRQSPLTPYGSLVDGYLVP